MAESSFVKVADLGELSPGEMKYVEVGDDQELLSNVEGTVYACYNACTHAFASLAEGPLGGDQVNRPLHGSVFNGTTGKVYDPPATKGLRVFQVRIEGQDILVGSPTGQHPALVNAGGHSPDLAFIRPRAAYIMPKKT